MTLLMESDPTFDYTVSTSTDSDGWHFQAKAFPNTNHATWQGFYLLNETGLTRGNLSTHLSKQEEAGYIKIEKTFRGKIPRTVCTLSEAGRTTFEKYRKQLRQIASRI